MLWVVLYVQVVLQVLSEAQLAPPQNISVHNWLMTWTPATQESNITYTVQYRSFEHIVWKNITTCTQISWNFCNVTVARAESEPDCVALRVLAERHLLTSGRLTSTPAEACSRHDDTCTPEVSLTARPGSLTVHLNRNHDLAHEHGDHALHRVYYGKEGEDLLPFEDTPSSVSIHELQKGQRYCAKVQYILYSEPVGLPSCTQCELIPGKDPKQTETIVAVVGFLFLVTLIPVIGYLLIYQRERIKQWLRPPCEIPSNFILDPFPEHYSPVSISSPCEEHCDVITCITPEEFRQ